MRGVKIRNDMMDDYRVYMLTDRQYRKLFMAAVAGERNVLSQFMRPFKSADRPSPCVWAVTRARIFARDDYTCRYCGERGKRLECDHVMPASRGGPHTDDNLVTACRPCNQSKRDKTPEEWRPA